MHQPISVLIFRNTVLKMHILSFIPIVNIVYRHTTYSFYSFIKCTFLIPIGFTSYVYYISNLSFLYVVFLNFMFGISNKFLLGILKTDNFFKTESSTLVLKPLTNQIKHYLHEATKS